MIATKTRKVIQVALCAAITVILGFLFFELIDMRSNPKHRVANWLGASIPNGASDFHYYYTQAPGYYVAHLIVRMRITKQDFLLLMNRMGAARDESCLKLPTDFNTDRTVTWWNPPVIQDERFFVKTNYDIETTCVWNADYGYIEKVGPFGEVFNWRTVQRY